MNNETGVIPELKFKHLSHDTTCITKFNLEYLSDCYINGCAI